MARVQRPTTDAGNAARAAVERAAAESAAISGKQKKTPTLGPVRYNLEAFGVAILGAVLLKWFCLEAFAIPTSSMQPTLMGSSEAGIHDRLLVDKLSPAWREPQRWDVTVFSYPLQKNQNYVKRLVGMPGETLDIGGGNLYRIVERDGQPVHEVLRKPERVQAGLWKEVYPLRQQIRGEAKALGSFFRPQPLRDAWSDGDEPGSFTVDLETGPRIYKLSFQDDLDGGFVNQVFDGYPVDVARQIREKAGQAGYSIVPDARIEATITAAESITELVLEVEVRRPEHEPLTFGLQIENGVGKLVVRNATETLKESGGKAFELPAGDASRVGFAHLDDELIAWRDGVKVLWLDVAEHHCRTGCQLPDDVRKDSGNHRATPQLRLKGKGRVAIDDLRIWRDLHYTRRANEFPRVQEPIEIPDGHYFMMGDNTLQSIDSRGWTAITVGVMPDGTVVPPGTEGSTKLRGNKRVVYPSRPPDRDETPVVIPSLDKIAMIDEFGEIHALDAKVSDSFLNAAASQEERAEFMFEAPGQDGRGDWAPPEEWVPFVPREHIRGRALLIFWRWPFPQLSPIR